MSGHRGTGPTRKKATGLAKTLVSIIIIGCVGGYGGFIFGLHHCGKLQQQQDEFHPPCFAEVQDASTARANLASLLAQAEENLAQAEESQTRLKRQIADLLGSLGDAKQEKERQTKFVATMEGALAKMKNELLACRNAKAEEKRQCHEFKLVRI